MISRSNLTITWLKPDIEEERWEFFNHPAKQQWYGTHAITWNLIISRFDSGTLVPYPRAALLGDIPVALSYHRYEEYQAFLGRAKRNYRKNYSKMEVALQYEGTLALKAPIILCSSGEGVLFSGYRRLCLGWNYGMVPHVWRVDLHETDRKNR